LAEVCDLVLYDIKAFDSGLHKQFTGANNQLILENAEKLAAMKKTMIIRMILVPGVNDDEKEIENRLSFVRSLGSAVVKLDILKYHRLGVGKNISLGLNDPMEGISECGDEIARKVLKRAAEMGLNASIDG
jgi:pyruvate formate lyase activating enzyme